MPILKIPLLTQFSTWDKVFDICQIKELELFLTLECALITIQVFCKSCVKDLISLSPRLFSFKRNILWWFKLHLLWIFCSRMWRNSKHWHFSSFHFSRSTFSFSSSLLLQTFIHLDQKENLSDKKQKLILYPCMRVNEKFCKYFARKSFLLTTALAVLTLHFRRIVSTTTRKGNNIFNGSLFLGLGNSL